jgi:hypothetical protein
VGEQGYRASIDPIASELSCRACTELRSLIDLASCSGDFLREHMRGFHYPEDGGDTFFRNVGSHKIYTATAFFIVTAVKTSNLTYVTLVKIIVLFQRKIRTWRPSEILL